MQIVSSRLSRLMCVCFAALFVQQKTNLHKVLLWAFFQTICYWISLIWLWDDGSILVNRLESSFVREVI